MAVTHHPNSATLMRCAAGTLPPALSAIVAAHAEGCPECAREMQRLLEIRVEKRPQDTLELLRAIAARWLQRTAQHTLAKPLTRGASSVARQVLAGLDRLSWRRPERGPVAAAPVDVWETATTNLKVLRMAPGEALSGEGLNGAELILILDGRHKKPREAHIIPNRSAPAERPALVLARDAAVSVAAVSVAAGERKGRFKGLLSWLGQPLAGS